MGPAEATRACFAGYSPLFYVDKARENAFVSVATHFPPESLDDSITNVVMGNKVYMTNG